MRLIMTCPSVREEAFITVLDTFSGIGGFSLGLEWAGFKTVAFCENDKKCRKVLQKHWPDVPIYWDIKELLKKNELPNINIVTGGDPCPVRSKARANRKTKHPDLSGYFLAVVGKLRPGWVVRENVPASDDKDFYTALELLGYRAVVVRANSFPLTAQNRTRDFIVGCHKRIKVPGFYKLFKRQSGDWIDKKGNSQTEGYPCLTTHRKRYDPRDGYIWDGERLRVADKNERCKLAGFPNGWLNDFSETACARMFGNSVVPQIPYLIGKAIMEVENEQRHS